MVTLSKLSLFLFCSSACLLIPSIRAKTDFKYCDKNVNYAVKVQNIKIHPYPVKSGKPVAFNISASTGEPIIGGTLTIQVYFFGISVYKEARDLCDEASCPISRGGFMLSHTQTLPPITPPGLYTLKMTMEDDKKQKLTCISFKFRISFGSFVSDN